VKKKQLDTLEKINEDRKLDKETKEKIRKRVFKNFTFAIGILLFFVILKLMAINLEKKVAIVLYKEFSVGILVINSLTYESYFDICKAYDIDYKEFLEYKKSNLDISELQLMGHFIQDIGCRMDTGEYVLYHKYNDR
jgi:hypothetical protein